MAEQDALTGSSEHLDGGLPALQLTRRESRSTVIDREKARGILDNLRNQSVSNDEDNVDKKSEFNQALLKNVLDFVSPSIKRLKRFDKCIA